jgi:hypothetical protein
MMQHIGIDMPGLGDALEWIIGGGTGESEGLEGYYRESDTLPGAGGFHKLILLYADFMVQPDWIVQAAADAGFRIVNLQQTVHPDYPDLLAYIGDVATDGFDRPLLDLKAAVDCWAGTAKYPPVSFVQQQLDEAAWATWKAKEDVPTDIEVEHKIDIPWAGIAIGAGILMVGGFFLWRISR